MSRRRPVDDGAGVRLAVALLLGFLLAGVVVACCGCGGHIRADSVAYQSLSRRLVQEGCGYPALLSSSTCQGAYAELAALDPKFAADLARQDAVVLIWSHVAPVAEQLVVKGIDLFAGWLSTRIQHTTIESTYLRPLKAVDL